MLLQFYFIFYITERELDKTEATFVLTYCLEEVIPVFLLQFILLTDDRFFCILRKAPTNFI